MKKPVLWALIVLSTTCLWGQRLPDTALPSHYQLTFTPDLQAAKFDGSELISIQVRKPTATITLNAVDIDFKSVEITSAGATQPGKATLNPDDEMATLTFAKPIAPGPAQLHIEFTGTLNDQLRGFYLSKTAKRNYAVTQMEPTDARRAFPSFDEPAMKATFDISLVIDKDDTAISNGKIVKDTPGPGEGKHTLTFSTTPKMSTYLVAMAVGDFKCVEGSQDNIPIRVCDVPGREHLLKFALEATKANLKYFDQYYAIKYPYGKLDIIAFPDFSAGAMENVAAITYRESMLAIDDEHASVRLHKLVTDVLSHEMAHQWFGDLVTMKWWDDIWLNEGFATWMSPKPLQAWRPDWHVEMDEVNDNAKAMNQDSLLTSRAIRNPANNTAEISQQFDAIAYEKGAAVLRMVESYEGEQTFRTGVNSYLSEHAYGNATSEDFWNTQTRVSKKPVDRIMASFVKQPGVPVVTVSSKCEAGKTLVTLSQERFGYNQDALRNSTEVWTIPICLKTPGGAARCELMTQKQQTVTMAGCAPYVYGNADARGYYRSSYDRPTLEKMAATVEKDLSAPERAQLVNDVWAMARSGRNNVDDFLALARGFEGERDYGVMDALGQDLRFISDYLVTEQDRPQYEAYVRNLLHPIAEEIGYRTKPNESDGMKEFRTAVLYTLGYAGRDPKVLQVAREMTEQALSRSGDIDPSLFGHMVDVASMYGDEALYERILAKLKDTNVPPNEFYTWMYALTSFRNRDLLARTLDYVAGPNVRNQDAPSLVQEVWANPDGRQLGWEYFKSHWQALKPKLATYGYGEMATYTSVFCDVGMENEVKTFFAANSPESKSVLPRAAERIDNCARFRQQQETRLASWLRQNTGSVAGLQ